METTNPDCIAQVAKKLSTTPAQIIRQGYAYFNVFFTPADLAKHVKEYEKYGAIPNNVAEYCRLILTGVLKL